MSNVDDKIVKFQLLNMKLDCHTYVKLNYKLNFIHVTSISINLMLHLISKNHELTEDRSLARAAEIMMMMRPLSHTLQLNSKFS
jgi:hypothetical protein